MSLKRILSLKKTRVLAITLILIIIIFIVYTFYYFNSGNKKLTDDEKQVIMNNIKNISNVEQRIKYIKDIIKHNDEKIFVFQLCNSYLEQNNPEKARSELLKKAKSSKKSIIERYDYISYFVGISLDYNLKIADSNVKLIKSIDKKLFKYLDDRNSKIEKKISILSKDLKKQKENSSKFYSINKKMQLLLQEKDQISIYSMDPFQLERMMGDYYYKMKEPELALYWYKKFYNNLNKPLSYYTIQPLRNYIQLLLDFKEINQAILYQGFLCNLSPYLFDDLYKLADLLSLYKDQLSSLFTLMFINTLSQSYDEIHYKKSQIFIFSILEKLKGSEIYQLAYNLVSIYLTGKDIETLPEIISKFQNSGINHFFFYYLLGLSYNNQKIYDKSIENLKQSIAIYPYCAEAYFFLLDSILSLEKEQQVSNQIDMKPEEKINLAEKVIELKPDSQISLICKTYLGKSIGLSEKQATKIITTPELKKMVDSYTKYGAPVNVFDPLLESFSNPKNVYQTAAIEVLSSIQVRKSELILYLKTYYIKANTNQREIIDSILSSLEK